MTCNIYNQKPNIRLKLKKNQKPLQGQVFQYFQRPEIILSNKIIVNIDVTKFKFMKL